MRNIEIRITKSGPDVAGLCQLFNDARLDERKSCAFAVGGTGDPHTAGGYEWSRGSGITAS